MTRREAIVRLAAAALPSGPVDLFRQGDGGVHTYRIPALIETRKGTLLAVADARRDDSRDLPARISLVLRRSRDRGKTWSSPVTLRQVPEGGVGDASLLLDRRTGRVWCFHACGPPGIGFAESRPGPRTLQCHAVFSDDEGSTWSEPRDLTPQIKDPAWQGFFATSGTHIQTGARRYLIPLVVRDGEGAVASRNAYSDDAGRTWNTGAAIGAGTDESKCVELSGGAILQNMRNGATRAIALSRDGGVTFGQVTHDSGLPDPSCNAGICRYRHKHRELLLFSNAAGARRENLTLKMSADLGKTWNTVRKIHPGPAAYSTVITLRDGSVAVLYECGESTPYEVIRFERFLL